jgi:hypothetical protein
MRAENVHVIQSVPANQAPGAKRAVLGLFRWLFATSLTHLRNFSSSTTPWPLALSSRWQNSLSARPQCNSSTCIPANHRPISFTMNNHNSFHRIAAIE